MADVYTVTFSIIGILISLPALLVALNLLWPNVTERTQTRLQQTPGRCFWFGIPVTAAFLLWIAITSSANVGPIRATAFMAGAAGLGIGTIGAAGLSRLLGERISDLARPNSHLTNLVRGAVVYELACLVPIVGWFLFIPLAGITVMGAAAFALLGWRPKTRVSQPSPTVGEQISVIGQ